MHHCGNGVFACCTGGAKAAYTQLSLLATLRLVVNDDLAGYRLCGAEWEPPINGEARGVKNFQSDGSSWNVLLKELECAL